MKYRTLLLFFICLSFFSASFAQQAQFQSLSKQSSKKNLLHNQSNFNMQPWNGNAYMMQWLSQQDPKFANEYQNYLQGVPSSSFNN